MKDYRNEYKNMSKAELLTAKKEIRKALEGYNPEVDEEYTARLYWIEYYLKVNESPESETTAAFYAAQNKARNN